MELRLPQTFESLNNSILACLVQNGGRIDSMNGGSNEEKSLK